MCERIIGLDGAEALDDVPVKVGKAKEPVQNLEIPRCRPTGDGSHLGLVYGDSIWADVGQN